MIVKSIDEGKFCCMVFCDLSKAFDRVWHKGLIYMYGISGNMLDWFESYLSNRTQKVMYRNIFSPVGHVKAGVPLGSVLGPLLFLLYVNDVAENMISVCRLYADDNSLQQCSDNINLIEPNLNHNLKILDEWSKMVVEIQFTENQSCIFPFVNVHHFPNLFFENCQLEYVTEHNILVYSYLQT